MKRGRQSSVELHFVLRFDGSCVSVGAAADVLTFSGRLGVKYEGSSSTISHQHHHPPTLTQQQQRCQEVISVLSPRISFCLPLFKSCCDLQMFSRATAFTSISLFLSFFLFLSCTSLCPDFLVASGVYIYIYLCIVLNTSDI